MKATGRTERMRIFVTGGTGYIGSALVERLVQDGHEVRCLVRPASSTALLERLGVRTFVGDVSDRYSMREGMSGADWVVHAAAALDPSTADGEMRRVNVGGSENVASLSFKLGIGRLLSISSIAYFGGSPSDGTPADESARPRLPHPDCYGETKYAGERAIQQWAERGLRVNTVYPSLVYGPPAKRQGANAVLRRIAQGRLPLVIGGDRLTSWVYLADLVEGMRRVMARAEPGSDYLLVGDVVTINELIGRVCAAVGLAPPRWSLPASVARRLATATAPLFRLVGQRPPLDPRRLANLERHWNFDDARARRELGWRPRTLAEGLPPTLRAWTGH